MNVYAIGASRNIGYYVTLKLLEKGATITFLLRSPNAFDNDEKLGLKYKSSGQVRIVQGDALKAEDVARGWEVAQEGPNSRIDLVLFTLGGAPTFSILKGMVISPADLCTRGLLNLLRTMPASLRPPEAQPKIIAISSTGITQSSHHHLPFLWRVIYPWLLASPHADKLGMERVLAYCAAWDWKDHEPRPNVLPSDWKTVPGTPKEGELKKLLVIRPALLTDGECKGDVATSATKKAPYRVGEGDLDNNGYTISRKDVAHFIVEGALQNWEQLAFSPDLAMEKTVKCCHNAGVDKRLANDPLDSGLDMPNDIAQSTLNTTKPEYPLAETKTTSSYWFEDGSVIARLRDHNFKIHKSLLVRHSPFLSSLSISRNDKLDVPILDIPEGRATVEDFTALLGHLYHDTLLGTSSFQYVASLLRISSVEKLHYPALYNRARERFQDLFPSTVEHFVHPEDPEEALHLAIEHNIRSAQKPLYYSVATTSHYDHNAAEPHHSLSKDVTARCASLQDSLISHFTPILFTVATASHMACTDIFAETWMPLVIAPALEDNGLCTPIETLRKIQRIKWEERGVCAECCKEKREEWEEEARNIWAKIDDWLDLKSVKDG
ncbi:hypothetical protein NM688_g7397 [Phlebia brevispora]|uniref:Uncharacterized protein n=1 Tax=Phlebia brevispora TaxID=194682 RepID=A0ACC1S5M9_9APHY|nr:hypothetical protein NM688_g7397 [Phlebia brevispora]